MGKIIYFGSSFQLSQLRSQIVECGYGGYTTASSIRGAIFANPPSGVSATGSFASQFGGRWINSRCWTLSSDGGGSVAVTSPWYSGYTSGAIYPPQSYGVSSSYDVWVTLNASPNSGYNFDFWYRQEPFEIWSYSANVSYYIPTDGWQNTWRITAQFSAAPPPPSDCYSYQLNEYDYVSGIDCDGNSFGYWNYSFGMTICARRLDSGGYQMGICDPNCLVKGTMVEMADGTFKAVEDIRSKDMLKGVAIQGAPTDDTIKNWSTDSLEYDYCNVKVIHAIPVKVNSIYSFNNGIIESSESHAHFIKRGNTWKFMNAKDLIVGDYLIKKDGTTIEITSIDIIEGENFVYDIDVETQDTYIANGFITHNREFKAIQ